MKKKFRGLSTLLLAVTCTLQLAGGDFHADGLPEILAKTRHDGARFAAGSPVAFFQLVQSVNF